MYIYLLYVCIYYFFTCWPFPQLGVAPTEEEGNLCVPDTFFTIVLRCEPQQKLTFHSQPPSRFIHPAGDSPTACHTPLHILRHSFLCWTLTLASWMLRPFLANSAFTPSMQHFVGLPLLTPLTSDSYTLVAILSSPILSAWPNHLSVPTLINSLTHTYIFSTSCNFTFRSYQFF